MREAWKRVKAAVRWAWGSAGFIALWTTACAISGLFTDAPIAAAASAVCAGYWLGEWAREKVDRARAAAEQAAARQMDGNSGATFLRDLADDLEDGVPMAVSVRVVR